MSEIRERILDKIQPEPNTGCWLWMGALTFGYGRFWVNGRNARAHRISYEAFVGPIPDGLVIDHTCRQKSCVNPEHLEVVTHKENVRRGLTGYAIRDKCRSGKHKITAVSFFTYPNGWRRCRQCRTESQRRRRADEIAASDAKAHA